MPLTPAYTWSENEHSVHLAINGVPIKDQSQVFCSDRVVKLNAPPYLLLLDLKDAIDDDRSTATVLSGRDIRLQLVKARPGLWGSIAADGDKKVIKQQRDESIQRAHQKQVAAQQERLARKQKEERAAIDHQIATEKAQRARLEALKQQELLQERQQLQDWKQQLPGTQQQAVTAPTGQDDESDYEDDLDEGVSCSAKNDTVGRHKAGTAAKQQAMPDHPDYYGKGWQPSSSKPTAVANGAGPATVQDESSSSLGSQQAEEGGSGQMIELSASRNSSSASQGRPSVLQSLVKSAAVAATNGCEIFADDNHHSTSSSPGDLQLLTVVSSTRNSNSGQASAAGPQQHIQQAPTTPAPAIPARPAKPQAPVRCRAAPVPVTFTQLQMQHLPAREQREVEIKSIKRQAKTDSVDISDRQPAFLKDKGDALAAQGNYRGAINAYTRAIELDPTQPSLWSNRAACHLALGAAAECEADCTAAIELLQQMQATVAGGGAAAASADKELLAGLLQAAAGTAAVGNGHVQEGHAGVVDAEFTDAESEPPAPDAQALEPQEGSSQSEQPAAAQPSAAAAGTAADGADSNSGPAALQKLRQQLVKVLSRRAAARVELQRLQEAADDLEHALRLDPANEQLKADALEIAAALNPGAAADPASLKQRADARFKAGDMQGATEAYTAVLQLLELQGSQQGNQEQQVPQKSNIQQLCSQNAGPCNEAVVEIQTTADRRSQQLQDKPQQQWKQMKLAALSNRAACWLSLENYQACVDDCMAALQVSISTHQASGPPHSSKSNSNTGESQMNSNSCTTAGSMIRIQTQANDSAEADAAAADSVRLLLQQLQDQSLQQLLATVGDARIRSIARLLARAAVAYVCLKQLQPAVELYGTAERCWQALGDNHRASELAADRKKLQQLLSTQAGR